MCILDNEVFAWVWVCHGAHFRHNYPVGCHVRFIGVTSEKPASVSHFSCRKKEERNVNNSYSSVFLHNESVIRNVWFLIQVRNKGRTVFKGEAVHDGHPIEPVLVAGFAHGEDARAITQQSALQPAGDVPCAPENDPNTYAVPSLRVSLLLKLKLGEKKKKRVASPFTSAFCGSGLSSAFLVKLVDMVARKRSVDERSEVSV